MNGKWNDYDSVMEEVKCKGSSLENASNELKNNYYTDKEKERKKHWELEYDMFKIVGTFDNIPKEIKEIEKIIKEISCQASKKSFRLAGGNFKGIFLFCLMPIAKKTFIIAILSISYKLTY